MLQIVLGGMEGGQPEQGIEDLEVAMGQQRKEGSVEVDLWRWKAKNLDFTSFNIFLCKDLKTFNLIEAPKLILISERMDNKSKLE